MKNKISTKIILCVVICSVLISAVVGVTAIKESTSEIKDEAYGRILNIAESRGNEYSIEIQKTENSVREYAQIISDNIDITKVKDVNYMNTFQNQFGSLTKSIGVSNKGIVGLYINFNPEITGGSQPFDLAYFYDDRTKESEIDYNSYTKDEYYESNEELSWYYNPIKAKAGVWSKPYVDPKSNNIKMISYTMPVYKDGQLLGVAGLDISFENLQKMILDTSLYDTGSAFLLDKDYNFLVDKTKTSDDNLSTMDDGKYDSIIESMKNKKEAALEMNFEGQKTVIGYYTLSNGQIMGVRVPTKEFLKDINNLTGTMIIVIAIGMILSSLLGSYISRKISTPIETATKFMQKLARLDLTGCEENIDAMVSNKDETGLMMESLANQRNELIKIVKVLKKNSLQILQDAEIISTAENETVESITMISNVMEQLLERAGEQAKEVRKGSFKLNNLAEEIEESVESISNLAENAIEMQRMQEQGSQSLMVLSEELNENIKSASSVGNSMDELLKNVNLVGELIGAVKLICDEINTLSKSESLELGETKESAGDVLVVHKKIGKLSEKSTEFISKVDDIIDEIQKDIKSGKKNVENSKGTLQEVNKMMAISNEALNGIAMATSSTMGQIKNLVLSINKVNKDKDEMLDSIEEISLLTEEVAVSVENVTASIAEQEVAMKSTSERTIELKKVSEVLGKVVQKFEV